MNDESQRIAPAAIRKTIEVKAPIDRAFAVFATRMGEWWHKQHSINPDAKQADVVIEPRSGGRWYEVGDDGSKKDWGRVIAYDPPGRLMLAWQLTREFAFDPDFETVIEVNFEARGELTIVHFEHRDLERMGADAVETLEGMDGGWAMLLGLYKAVVDRA